MFRGDLDLDLLGFGILSLFFLGDLDQDFLEFKSLCIFLGDLDLDLELEDLGFL